MERPKPKQHKEFELMIREFISYEYPDYNGHFTLYGRNGQRQYGCDVKDQAGKLIVQCKCYDNYDPKSGDKLVEKIGEDYEKACGHFTNMELFVVCTTLSRSTDIEDRLKALKKNVPIHVYFCEDIESVIHSSYTANKKYAEQFEEPLFLHKDDPKVCLKNLFVPQKYSEGRDAEGNPEVFDDLYGRIGRFVSNPDESLLIIEGDAGCGKTSLVQSLCYHDREGDELAEKTLGGRPLVTIRLRDINKNLISAERGLMPSIAAYLGIEASRDTDRITELNKRFPHAVLILDGFDELCIIEGISYYDRLLAKLSHERLDGWKFIVVSRPNYINVSRSSSDSGGINDIPHASIALRHFDEEKRTEWMESFTDPDKCSGTIEEGMKQFILESSEEGVCDTPLTLYLLTSTDGIDEKTRGNLWRLYNRIFGREIIYRQYEEDHLGADYAEAAYRLAELVAHEIYLTGNEKLYVDEEQLEDIAEKLPGEYKEKRGELAKHCLGLSCYLEAGERGMAEFYHNNIRDYFLCEMIWRRVNEIYSNKALTKEEKCDQLIAFFRDNFKSDALVSKTCEFIRLKSLAYKEDEKTSFPTLENNLKLLPSFFEKIITDNRIYSGLNEKYLLRLVASIVHCVMQFYQAALEPFLTDRLCWYTDVNTVNQALLLRTSFATVHTHCFSLSFSQFSGIDLRYSNLSNVNLNRSDLTNADLTCVDLTHAKLDQTQLVGTFLSRAYLMHASLISSNLTCATLTRTDLSYASLTDAILEKADLTKAELSHADLKGAILTNATLPDGFISDDQDEQVEHLKSLNIEGLII